MADSDKVETIFKGEHGEVAKEIERLRVLAEERLSALAHARDALRAEMDALRAEVDCLKKQMPIPFHALYGAVDPISNRK